MSPQGTGKKDTVKITVFTLLAVIGLAAVQAQAGGTGDSDALVRNAMIQRIEPVGKVRTAASDAQSEAIAVAVEEPADAAAAESTEAAAEGAETAAESTEATAGAEEGAEAVVESAAVESPEAADAADAEPADAEPAAADAGGASGVVDAAALLALIGSGTEPEGVTDNIKSTVDGICIGCHLAGVAGAPKIADKEAWGPRTETGLAAMTATVISGKNAMPPRGASTLTDEEIPLAVQYLISKQ